MKVSILARLLRRAQQGEPARVAHPVQVSILARLLRRAQHAGVGCQFEVECFNPRPTVTPGATLTGATIADGNLVSILARLLRRAQRSGHD